MLLSTKTESENVNYKMTARSSWGRLVAIAITVVVLFVLGFVIGWVSAPADSDGSSSKKIDMKDVAKKRQEQMKQKSGFHEKLFDFLNAEKIGENLRLVHGKIR